MSWKRYRFKANPDDYRPVKFPPPGPYWCSGSGGDDDNGTAYSVVIAYLPPEADVLEWWPEAVVDDDYPQDHDKIVFSSRFPRPKWWTGEGEDCGR